MLRLGMGPFTLEVRAADDYQAVVARCLTEEAAGAAIGRIDLVPGESLTLYEDGEVVCILGRDPEMASNPEIPF